MMRFQKGFVPIAIIVVFVILGVGIFAVAKSNKFQKPSTQTGQDLASASPDSVLNPFLTTSITPTLQPTTLPNPTRSPSPKPTKSPVPVPTMHQITVSGFAYEDRNDNGVMDSDDPKLPNMQLFFYDVAKPTIQINTVFTDNNGNFSNSIDVIQGIIVKPTTYNNFRPRGDSMTFAGNYNSIQIGFRSASAPAPNLTGIIEGDVYQDTNRNNIRDSNESGTFFYKLYLVDSSGNYYNTVENAQTTDAGGHFKWVNLPADRTFTIKLSGMDVIVDKTEYPYTLSGSHTQETNIQIPVYKTSNW